MAQAKALAGLTLREIAREHGWPIPDTSRSGKGWPGQLIEDALGASAASLPEPDFQLIGVELKTIPVDTRGRPRESTYVCSVPLDDASTSTWEESNVRRKLARVLWIPLLCGDALPIGERRVGSPLLWSPDPEEEAALRVDWEEFMELICVGGSTRSAHTSAPACKSGPRPRARAAGAGRWGLTALRCAPSPGASICARGLPPRFSSRATSWQVDSARSVRVAAEARRVRRVGATPQCDPESWRSSADDLRTEIAPFRDPVGEIDLATLKLRPGSAIEEQTLSGPETFGNVATHLAAPPPCERCARPSTSKGHSAPGTRFYESPGSSAAH